MGEFIFQWCEGCTGFKSALCKDGLPSLSPPSLPPSVLLFLSFFSLSLPLSFSSIFFPFLPSFFLLQSQMSVDLKDKPSQSALAYGKSLLKIFGIETQVWMNWINHLL